MQTTRPTHPTSIARLDFLKTDDGSTSLFDRHLNETYHSGSGALSETWLVYIQNGEIIQRLKEWDPARRTTQFKVVEYGFGTGMGYLLTGAVAASQKKPMTFVALEKWLLPVEVLNGVAPIAAMEQAFSKDWQASYFEASQELFNEMIAWRSSLPGECPEGVFPFQSRLGIELIWVVGDAKNYSGDPYSTDCIYFDPFSPVTNPDLWNRQVMESALQNLVPGGKLCSYCVASKIRKRLEEVGFDVCRLPGPVGGKREVLVATKPK